MVKRCKDGKKRVGRVCVTKKNFKRFGQLADEVKIVRLAFYTSIASIGGWSIFKGILKITKMDTLPGWALILLGLFVIWLAYKFGFTKAK